MIPPPVPALLVAVVEDDASVRGALWRLLTTQRYQVRTFGSAEEFLASPETARTGCAIVDVDLGEGRTSGLDLAESLAAAGCWLPIVLVTGRPSAETARRAERVGCIALIEKPFEVDRLLHAVSQAIGQASDSSA
jgi:FixJ family two-component response regulator